MFSKMRHKDVKYAACLETFCMSIPASLSLVVVHLSVCLFPCLDFFLLGYLCFSVSGSVFLSVCLSVCRCLSVGVALSLFPSVNLSLRSMDSCFQNKTIYTITKLRLLQISEQAEKRESGESDVFRKWLKFIGTQDGGKKWLLVNRLTKLHKGKKTRINP